MSYVKNLVAAVIMTASTQMATAATIDFTGASLGTHTNYIEEGFQFDKLRIVSAYCANKAVGPCAAENAFKETTMTRINGGTFNVNSMWFSVIQQNAPLTLVTDHGTATFGIGTFLKDVAIEMNKGYNLDLTSLDIFKNISFLSIVDIALAENNAGHAKGDFRFDNIDVAPLPLPATGILLLAGMGAFAAVRRRKQHTE